MNILRSKTVWGAIVAVIGWLTSPDVLGTMPETIASVIQAVGIVWSVIGARLAISKAARGDPGAQS